MAQLESLCRELAENYHLPFQFPLPVGTHLEERNQILVFYHRAKDNKEYLKIKKGNHITVKIDALNHESPKVIVALPYSQIPAYLSLFERRKSNLLACACSQFLQALQKTGAMNGKSFAKGEADYTNFEDAKEFILMAIPYLP